MKASIITIGDEILIGQIVDTNSAWIAGRLNSIGIPILSRLSTGDDAGQIRNAVEEYLAKTDLVIMTGGLGPTRDDITKKTVADFFDRPLVMHRPTYEMVERMLAARGVEFNELNRSQAYVPDGCTVLANPNGTAPGMWMERDGKVLVCLPGVPFEMKKLMDDEVLPRIVRRFSLSANVHRTMLTYGIPESMLAERISGWESALPEGIKLAYLPSASGIRLRLSAYEVAQDDAEETISRQFAALEQLLGNHVVGYGDVTLASAVAGMLVENRLTLSVAESCTGGELSAQFTAMAGASRYFSGGVVAYSNQLKTAALGVDAANIENYGAVSREVALQMARGVKKLTGSDYGISTTGIAGPDGGTPEKPVGTVWIAVSGPGGEEAERFQFAKLRDQNIQRSAAAAINMLRMAILRG